MLHIPTIKAISLDLDDTLWPIWPTIERAEQVLHGWLRDHAPQAAVVAANPAALREIREQLGRERPDLGHDFSALRRESIRHVLARAGEDTALAEPAFEVFFAERQRVTFYDDALAALEFLAARYPLVAVSNGNSDLARVGIAQHFKAAISAREFGIAKPDPRIFHAAAAAVAVQPHELLHVGDDVTLDALGALDAGLPTIWLNRDAKAWPHERRPNGEVADLHALCALFPAR